MEKSKPNALPTLFYVSNSPPMINSLYKKVLYKIRVLFKYKIYGFLCNKRYALHSTFKTFTFLLELLPWV